ncbi:hypothetical protein PROFUN_11640 [Planoprotostelium fungivorum]|uniref:Uncharacterized protein n=1 Tax=Planoprotostelium fungivorum TaxID=1890364 RepID=A0A2P6N9Q2_9EUKA|nr:hypothetical protein PROFUN_11640 [Planoprotostelium fungivorum]
MSIIGKYPQRDQLVNLKVQLEASRQQLEVLLRGCPNLSHDQQRGILGIIEGSILALDKSIEIAGFGQTIKEDALSNNEDSPVEEKFGFQEQAVRYNDWPLRNVFDVISLFTTLKYRGQQFELEETCQMIKNVSRWIFWTQPERKWEPIMLGFMRTNDQMAASLGNSIASWPKKKDPIIEERNQYFLEHHPQIHQQMMEKLSQVEEWISAHTLDKENYTGPKIMVWMKRKPFMCAENMCFSLNTQPETAEPSVPGVLRMVQGATGFLYGTAERRFQEFYTHHSTKLELYDVPKKVDCMDIPYLFRPNLSVYRIGVIPRIGRLCIGVDEKYGTLRGGIDTHLYSEEFTISDEDLEESFDEDWEESDPPLRFFSNNECWEDQRADGRMIEPDLDDMVDLTGSDALKIIKDIAIICSARKYRDDFYTRLYKRCRQTLDRDTSRTISQVSDQNKKTTPKRYWAFSINTDQFRIRYRDAENDIVEYPGDNDVVAWVEENGHRLNHYFWFKIRDASYVLRAVYRPNSGHDVHLRRDMREDLNWEKVRNTFKLSKAGIVENIFGNEAVDGTYTKTLIKAEGENEGTPMRVHLETQVYSDDELGDTIENPIALTD